MNIAGYITLKIIQLDGLIRLCTYSLQQWKVDPYCGEHGLPVAMGVIAILVAALMCRNCRSQRPPNTKKVPSVAWRWPLVGHGPAFSKDIVGYIRKCHAQYGPIFRIKIFQTDMIIVCDNTLVDEYFAAKESSMSMYLSLDRLFFADGLAEDPKNMDTIIKTVRGTIRIDMDTVAPKIMDEGSKMIGTMVAAAGPNGLRTDLLEHMVKFIARTSARCFIGVDISDGFFDTLLKFSHLLGVTATLTYFIPKWAIRLLHVRQLRAYRKKMIDELKPTIQQYRHQLKKNDSFMIRRAVDMTVPTKSGHTHRSLTNVEIGEIIICLLYASSENTSIGLTGALYDLARHPVYWNQVRTFARGALAAGDYRSILTEPTIDACVMESARLNAHVFPLNRKPVTGTETLGNYFVGDTDCIALCEPMLMTYECVDGRFAEPEVYNPDRFLINGEKMDAKNVMTWGAGVHLCPGKLFALYEMKIGMAMVAAAFERPEVGTPVKNYFSPSAFAKQTATINLLPLPIEERVQSVPIAIGGATIVKYVAGGVPGWLIQNYLSSDAQAELLGYTVGLLGPKARAAQEESIKTRSMANPYPLAFERLVWTGTTNCATPIKWYVLAADIWKMMRDTLSEFDQSATNFNSFYSQVFGLESTLNAHKDEHCDWGVSISIGSSAEFLWGEHKIPLHSGSIFVADFSKVLHGISRIYPNTRPDWFDYCDQARLSVQIRSLSGPMLQMGTEEFVSMINSGGEVRPLQPLANEQ